MGFSKQWNVLRFQAVRVKFTMRNSFIWNKLNLIHQNGWALNNNTHFSSVMSDALYSTSLLWSAPDQTLVHDFISKMDDRQTLQSLTCIIIQLNGRRSTMCYRAFKNNNIELKCSFKSAVWTQVSMSVCIEMLRIFSWNQRSLDSCLK